MSMTVGKFFNKIVFCKEISRLYYKNLKSDRKCITKEARLVQGVIINKHIMEFKDSGVIEMIQDNPVCSIFLVFEAFTYEKIVHDVITAGSPSENKLISMVLNP